MVTVRARNGLIYKAICIILEECGGRCLQRDIKKALNWPEGPDGVSRTIKRLEKRGLLVRHNIGVPHRAFITLDGPRTAYTPPPAPIPDHILARLDLPDPWAEPGSDKDKIQTLALLKHGMESVAPDQQFEARARGHLLCPSQIAALYAGERYENFKGREFLDNTMPQREARSSYYSCTAAMAEQARVL